MESPILWIPCLLNKIYEEANYNAAFDRCVDVLTSLIQKYGGQVLDKKEATQKTVITSGKDSAQPISEKVA